MRQRARVDRNHGEIVKALRQAGCAVQDLSRVGAGCPDLAVGRAGVNYFLEIKDGEAKPSDRELTEAQENWHLMWPGQKAVVENVDEALRAVGVKK